MIAWLDRKWRLFAIGASFALFGVGGLVLAFVVFPALNLFVRDREKRAAMAQHVVHATWRLFLKTSAFLGAISYEFHGAEILRKERGAIVVANHPSLLDIVFIMSLMERTQCVIKAGVWRNPFMRGAVTAANYIPNLGDPERLIEDCVAALKAGNNIVIFPQGSRTPIGVKKKYERGFAHVALRANAPIRLVTVTCDPPTLRKGEPWYKVPAKKAHWVIRVHERIDVAGEPAEQALAVRRICAEVEARIEENLAA